MALGRVEAVVETKAAAVEAAGAAEAAEAAEATATGEGALAERISTTAAEPVVDSAMMAAAVDVVDAGIRTLIKVTKCLTRVATTCPRRRKCTTRSST